MAITKDITIEELVDEVQGAVRYLSIKGIKCIACGEPIWGTLEEAAKEKGFSDDEIEKFVEELINLKDNPNENKSIPRIDTKRL